MNYLKRGLASLADRAQVALAQGDARAQPAHDPDDAPCLPLLHVASGATLQQRREHHSVDGRPEGQLPDPIVENLNPLRNGLETRPANSCS